MTRTWRWAILIGSSVVLGVLGYLAGGDSDGTLLGLIGLIGGGLIVARLLSIGQTVSDHIRDIEATPSHPASRRPSAADAELIAASDPVTRDLVPDLLEALPGKLEPGERLADAAVAKAFGGPGLLAITDQRVLFIPSAQPEQLHEVGFGQVSSVSDRATGELVALSFLGPWGSSLFEVEVSPQNATRIAIHTRDRIQNPPVTPDPHG